MQTYKNIINKDMCDKSFLIIVDKASFCSAKKSDVIITEFSNIHLVKVVICFYYRLFYFGDHWALDIFPSTMVSKLCQVKSVSLSVFKENLGIPTSKSST